jgi:excinuclease ABC subunit C
VIAMVRHARSVEWHTVGSEVEALILESQLVKRYQPPYNVQLRDYPHYTFLHQADGGGFAYFEPATSVEPEAGAHFGPFWGRRSADQTLEFVNRLFLLRRCTGDLPTEKEGRACFYAQVRRCSAPCLGRITAVEYAAAIRSAGDLLKGDVGRLIRRLERERDAAAESLRFERAAELHQAILTLRSLQSKRRHLRSASNTNNFLVVVRQPNKGAAQVLAFSAARLRGQVDVEVSAEALTETQRVGLLGFLLAHYPVKRQLAINLDELDQMDVVAEWLARQGRQAVYVPLPDGPLTQRDAEGAVDAVARALAGQPTGFDAPARMDVTPNAGAVRFSQQTA